MRARARARVCECVCVCVVFVCVHAHACFQTVHKDGLMKYKLLALKPYSVCSKVKLRQTFFLVYRAESAVRRNRGGFPHVCRAESA